MKRLLAFLIATLLLLSSCEDSAIREGRQAYKAYFHDTLKDPESLKIYNEEVTELTKGVSAVFVVDMGAKNSYGAYVREIYKFTTIGEKVRIIEVGGDRYFNVGDGEYIKTN